MMRVHFAFSLVESWLFENLNISRMKQDGEKLKRLSRNVVLLRKIGSTLFRCSGTYNTGFYFYVLDPSSKGQ